MNLNLRIVLYEVAAGLNFRSHSPGELITREFPLPSNPKLPLLCAFLGEESIFAKCDAAFVSFFDNGGRLFPLVPFMLLCCVACLTE